MFKTKRFKYTILMFVIIGSIFSTAMLGETSLFTAKKEVPVQKTLKEQKETSTVELTTNRYTQPDQQEKNNQKIDIPADFEKAAKTEELELYFNKDTLSFFVKDLRSGYVWSSKPTDQMLEKESLNEDWSQIIQSPVMVEFFNSKSGLERGSFSSLDGKVKKIESIENGIRYTIILAKLQTEFSIEIQLDHHQVTISVPEESWIEKQGKIGHLYVYPFLGSTRVDDVPGYMMIPDGSGALIRFKQPTMTYEQPYVGRIYGDDLSVKTSDNLFASVAAERVSMPVFGLVHGERQNAMLGEVKEGKFSAEIVAFPSGVNTNFNWTAARFIVRNSYFQPTSKSMGGFNTYQKKRIEQDFKVSYTFLENQDATYVGMAKAYRDALVEEGVLKKLESKKTVPMQVDFLGGEMEPGMFWNKYVKMTSFEEIGQIVSLLKEKGISDLNVNVAGWENGGLTGKNPDKFPAAKELGGADAIRNLAEKLKQDAVSLSLQADYTYGYKDSNRFNEKTEAARKITNGVLEQSVGYERLNEDFLDLSRYYINPAKAVNLLKEDIKEFEKLNVANIALINTSTLLFSDFKKGSPISREEAAEHYLEIGKLLSDSMQEVSMYKPNDYLLPFADKIYDLGMESSQYMYATDTIPFTQMVLHGYVDYYMPPLNFSSNSEEDILQMIEIGAIPSFYFTKEQAHLLNHGPSNHIYASYYKDWTKEVKQVYDKIQEPLKAISGEAIVDRVVHSPGVVEVKYSNHVSIIVNYQSNKAAAAGQAIAPRSFVVLKEGKKLE
ncbi:DUF5696 domain-containing protein [Bacillus sp. UMB0893]|uniref:DUF5696 domain-containing protein n=1 Tax=Bacillus sp. UMB0893 TaxID=2066053 RepID=UPI000C767A56|nr:DUF5696 domain-containing protein [Bacillus sp. UMB0893]PLR67419.1 hypothetical protein CYJ36_12190 [Bacillus sp. UMB0893]